MSDEQVFEGSKPMPSDPEFSAALAALNGDKDAFKPGAPTSVLYTTRQYPCGCRAEGSGDVPNYCPEHGAPTRKTITTQQVPHLVYEAIVRHVNHTNRQMGPYPHAAIRIHPRDWQFLEDFLRQQGQLKEVDGPMGWVEIEGLTVLKDMSANVPHLDLSVG